MERDCNASRSISLVGDLWRRRERAHRTLLNSRVGSTPTKGRGGGFCFLKILKQGKGKKKEKKESPALNAFFSQRFKEGGMRP